MKLEIPFSLIVGSILAIEMVTDKYSFPLNLLGLTLAFILCGNAIKDLLSQ